LLVTGVGAKVAVEATGFNLPAVKSGKDFGSRFLLSSE
jgi:hypothetical protein